MRKLFELNLHCSKCGERLGLVYAKDLDKGVHAKHGATIPDQECGGYKVKHDLFVEPCRVCTQDVKKEVSSMLRSIESVASKLNESQ